MSNTDVFFDTLRPILTEVDNTLQELFDGKENICVQIPTLLGNIKLKMNWDDKQMRAKDPIIRDYLRQHPEWHVTRGAGGGIMRASEKQQREAAKLAKEKAKADVAAAIDAEVAKKAAATQPAPDDAADNTNTVSE
jgi:hypothetical protein